MTDQLGANVRIIPTCTDISATDFAQLFFDHWYCENGLPLEIISDHDKLFTSSFWSALTQLSGIKLGMSTTFHPETDGSSERSNKTVNQLLRYHIDHAQAGWVQALPRICFMIMNTVNASTKFSPFQLCMGHSPRLIPPFSKWAFNDVLRKHPQDASDALGIIAKLQLDILEAQDNLLEAKVHQAALANVHRHPDNVFVIGDKVMLNTKNRRWQFASPRSHRVTKFFPRFNGPYVITASFPNTSTYILQMPHVRKNSCTTFHASQLMRHIPNDNSLFPSHSLGQVEPVTMPDRSEEFLIDRIIDQRRCGKGFQYLVHWLGMGPEEDEWLPRREIEETEALDRWLEAVSRLENFSKGEGM
jgi:Chromo (CHRromatin Organisation MOdifier) domain